MQRQLTTRTDHRLVSHLPLSLRISILLILAALLPLLVTVVGSELLSRPALVDPASLAMQTDAHLRVQLIDTYLNERMLDAKTLSMVPSLQEFMMTPPQRRTPDLALHASYSLIAGMLRDTHYAQWTVFDPQGGLLLYYPTNNKPTARGKTLVPSYDLQAVNAGKSFFTSVYRDLATQRPAIDMYTPVVLLNTHTIIGFARATLYMEYIWTIVDDERGANGAGSSAFILDADGVRIADTDPTRRFSAIAPLSPQSMQRATDEDRYGQNSSIRLLADTQIAAIQQQAHPPTTFQAIPAGQDKNSQITRLTTTMVPWTYFVLSPQVTVEAVVDQQMITTFLLALMVLGVAAITGLIVGRNIVHPLRSAAGALYTSIHQLQALATRQRDAATEQTWVVNFFVGTSQQQIQSISYYTNATGQAAHKLQELVEECLVHWQQGSPVTTFQTLEQIRLASNYIERAARLQEASQQRSEAAISVMVQVNDGLIAGSASAARASEQLTIVVKQLQHVIGVEQH
jgi:hypothetical protein